MHLNALRLNLSNERSRLGSATAQFERDLRTVYVAQLEKEVAGELAFLGLPSEGMFEPVSDNDLLAELLA